ncbi:hypothetical protein [Kribbella antiqua]|nr:hypothetical protein [Kribbella antiqua]
MSRRESGRAGGSARVGGWGRRFGHPAYGVLVAAGAAAVIVLVVGLVAVGALDDPVNQAAAVDQSTGATPARTETADPTAQNLSTHSPTAEAPTTRTPGAGTTGGPGVGTPSAGVGTPGGEGSAGVEEWVRTLQALDAQRAQAFWTLDVGVLDRIYVPGSAPWSADRELVAAYRRQQVRVHGLRIRIETTTIERRTASSITLRTVDHLVGGEVVDRNGNRTPLPPGTATTRLITLSTTPSTPSWRITTITSA